MRRKDITYRITKIGNKAVSVAVCGLMVVSVSAMATTYNLHPSTTSITVSTSTNSVDVTYNDSDASSESFGSGSITITLNPGVNLTGQSPIGSVVGSVFSRDTEAVAGGIDTVTFLAANTTLNLGGNNSLTGVVGWHFATAGDGTSDPVDLINLNGTGVTFNSVVYANRIDFNQGGTAQFFGSVDGESSTALNYNGHNASVTFHNNVTLDGNITNSGINGSLIFTANATITGSVGNSSNATSIGLIESRGNASTVRITGGLATDRLDYQANSTVSIGGSLDLNNNTNSSASNTVAFNGFNSTLQVGGNIIGSATKPAVSTTQNGTGTVTMLSGTQSITGDIGSSTASISTLNIGGTGNGGTYDTSTDVNSTTTVDGDIFAQTIRLNNDNSNTNDSELIVASGHNITGNVVTESGQNGRGILTLAGGNQTVTGTVGASGASLRDVNSGSSVNSANSTFTGAVFSTNVTNTGNGTSTFEANVTATNVNVAAGISNFETNLSATTTTIGTGTGNFNTVGGTTTSNIVFSGNGTGNLNQGLTGAIDFDNKSGVINLFDGKTITGAITGDASSSAFNGTVNALGGGTLSADVTNVSSLNVNRLTAGASENAVSPVSATLTANGNVTVGSAKLYNDGVLEIADNKNLTLTTNLTTAAVGTGTLSLLGTSNVSGNIGAAGTGLKAINAGVVGETVEFSNGTAYANTLQYQDNGIVIFNGQSAGPATFTNGSLDPTAGRDLGFVGTVDFKNGSSVNTDGKLYLGDGVDLITQYATTEDANSRTAFNEANNATLRFEGNSVVIGDLGSATVVNGTVNAIGTDTFGKIEAGLNNQTVTFMGNVSVKADTLNVGDGTVNLMGDLNGTLEFDANGTVNVGDGKVINGVVRTDADNTGNLNFVGSTTTQAPIGTPSARLLEVNFHATTSDSDAMPIGDANQSINIGHDVYAVTTTIGNGSSGDGGATEATITATGKHLGTNLTLTNTTTLNTAGAVTINSSTAVSNGTAVSLVDFGHIKLANGTLTNNATVSKSTTGTGVITTNNATINFAIGTTPWASNAGGTVNTSASSSITGGTGSTLTMSGGEVINLSLLGSLRNGQTYTLIDVSDDNNNTSLPPSVSNLRDNSFVITTALTRSNNNTDSNADLDGDLVVTATRADGVYITLSNTSGHFSNPAALRLGTLAADGSTYGQDLQTALNMLDIDQWGYGNNATNLAVQAKRLAPIANNSYVLTAFRSASLVGDSIGMRMHQLRIPEKANAYQAQGIWIRTLNLSDTQAKQSDYDGFKTETSGVAIGLDAYPNQDSLVGGAFSFSSAKLKQQDFRLGDEATIEGIHATVYGAYNFTPEFFVGGQLTGSWVNTTGNRSTAVGRVAKSDYDAYQVSGKIDFGYKIKLGGSAIYLTPMASYEASSLDQDGYTETNAGDIGLIVAKEKFKRNQAAVGFRLDGTGLMGGIVVKPQIGIFATRDSGTYAKPVTAQYIGDYTADASFDTQVAQNTKKDGAKVSLGLGLLLNKTTSVALQFEHSRIGKGVNTTGDTYKANTLDLSVRWNY